MKVENMSNVNGLYLYESMGTSYKPALDMPCIYGGHCDYCPRHKPWDMTIETDRYKDSQIVLTQGRASYGEPLGRKVVSVLLSRKDENGKWITIENGIKTFLLPDCLEGYKWLLDFVERVYLSAIITGQAADWEFRSYFPNWDVYYMSRYFLTGEREA